MICSKNLIKKLLKAYQEDRITIKTQSKDFDSWYNKRTEVDGKVDFHARTREIYNLIRGVAAPFPGAFAYVKENNENDSEIRYRNNCESQSAQENKIIIWQAHPFDEMIDFSEYEPGEVIDLFDEKLVIRTVDGSLLIDKYECRRKIRTGDILY